MPGGAGGGSTIVGSATSARRTPNWPRQNVPRSTASHPRARSADPIWELGGVGVEHRVQVRHLRALLQAEGVLDAGRGEQLGAGRHRQRRTDAGHLRQARAARANRGRARPATRTTVAPARSHRREARPADQEPGGDERDEHRGDRDRRAGGLPAVPRQEQRGSHQERPRRPDDQHADPAEHPPTGRRHGASASAGSVNVVATTALPSPPRARQHRSSPRDGAAARARRNIPKQEERHAVSRSQAIHPKGFSADRPNRETPGIRRGPLGVSVRGALPCSQVFRHRRTGDRRRADGAATSRHPVRRRRGHPEGLRHRRPATGGTTASYLPVLDVPRVVIRGSSCCHDDVVVRSPVGPTSTACPQPAPPPRRAFCAACSSPRGGSCVEVPALSEWSSTRSTRSPKRPPDLRFQSPREGSFACGSRSVDLDVRFLTLLR